MKGRRLSASDRERIVELYAAGVPVATIAADFRVARNYPSLLAHRYGVLMRETKKSPRPYAGKDDGREETGASVFHVGDNLVAVVRRDAARLLRLIPPDTRDLTAQLCGDPLVGRRALDLRGQ